MPLPPARPSRVRQLAALAVVLMAGAVATGCGQVDETGAGVRVLITTDQGARTVLDRPGVRASDDEPALEVLRRAAKTEVDGRGAVTSIDGRRASGDRRWTLWLNGSPMRSGALAATKQDVNLQQLPVLDTVRTTKVSEGDTIWLDLGASPVVPRGVVGTFPEPFLHGQEGKRWPVRVECGEERAQACRMVRDALVRYGIPAVSNLVRTSYNPGSARIAVGTWVQLREDPSLGLAERGARTTGIPVVPAKDGRSIGLTGADGRVTRTLGAGSGAIFAARWRDEPPSWAVTGTDDAGVLRAAGALDETVLKKRFAVGVDDRGAVIGVPSQAAPARR
ncbi:hypothetical protein [Patulibacter sp.]|uniref:hypothetical protein n=1 Tax=Patulibacter sp. TaxID=1912859 RepID=UPI002722AD17|nr:hypothetical protein [Patulibacter sp.]MDO9409664.1 hypothetical protein [Patulibacter sp.]